VSQPRAAITCNRAGIPRIDGEEAQLLTGPTVELPPQLSRRNRLCYVPLFPCPAPSSHSSFPPASPLSPAVPRGDGGGPALSRFLLPFVKKIASASLHVTRCFRSRDKFLYEPPPPPLLSARSLPPSALRPPPAVRPLPPLTPLVYVRLRRHSARDKNPRARGRRGRGGEREAFSPPSEETKLNGFLRSAI